MSQVWTKLNQMSAREAMIVIAGKPGFGEQPNWLKAVANAANISRRAARDLWRGAICDPDHRAFVAVIREAERIERERAYRNEKAALAAHYRQFAEKLRASDEEFHSPLIDLVEHFARTLGPES
jgi:hypothetical protein